MPKKLTAVKKRKSVVKKAVKKTVAKKKVVKKKGVAKPKKQKKVVMHANDVHEPLPAIPHVCRGCHALPAGSVELVSLLLVLVFALSAVLITSVYALNQQGAQMDNLETQIAHVQVKT
ncbi:hypothetical protein HN358_00135 [Candidatus Uhrbacteria bacterium]|jgi:hypothetical protein|nr:hypothetical protein [Candidatus Uhrbacteria bacterium]MBT7717257.1 hypothetical protein [Candidatus Uhrbacteria bacterium]